MTMICIMMFAILLSGSMIAYTNRETAVPNYINLVKAYESANNAHDIDTVMTMFTEDAQFELVGQETLPNREAIQAIHEYDKGINTRLTFQNCSVEGLIVTCTVAEQNDWLIAANLGEIFYPSSIFTFTETGKIQKIAATLSAEDGAAMGGVLAEFIPWLMAERAQESAPLFTPEGQFVYSEANGLLVVDLLAQWQAGGNQ